MSFPRDTIILYSYPSCHYLSNIFCDRLLRMCFSSLFMGTKDSLLWIQKSLSIINHHFNPYITELIWRHCIVGKLAQLVGVVVVIPVNPLILQHN